MFELNKYLKISELSRISGVSIPRIRYYIGKGLLPKPLKVDKNQAFYTSDHLKKLEIVKALKDKKRISPALRELMNSSSISNDVDILNQPKELQIVRSRIIQASIPVFRKKGYEGATIGEIAKSARINRNSIYKYFKNKQDLFISCINEIIVDYRTNLPNDAKRLTETKDTEVIKELLSKIGEAFSKTYPAWSDMMNLLRSAAVKEPRIFAPKLDEAYGMRIKPLINDFDRLIKQRIFRNIDPYLAAIIIAGANEYANYFISRGQLYGKEAEIRQSIVDIMLYGLLRRF